PLQDGASAPVRLRRPSAPAPSWLTTTVPRVGPNQSIEVGPRQIDKLTGTGRNGRHTAVNVEHRLAEQF
ncbi:MAG TPA: hypothetical protein VN709_07120, partial [Terriglobales bacterium]|nr:hypothetical protein [Terriglobales bacterium]